MEGGAQCMINYKVLLLSALRYTHCFAFCSGESSEESMRKNKKKKADELHMNA
jgi:sulfite exporter TauE/SafE